jgi:hypothetical protein
MSLNLIILQHSPQLSKLCYQARAFCTNLFIQSTMYTVRRYNFWVGHMAIHVASTCSFDMMTPLVQVWKGGIQIFKRG